MLQTAIDRYHQILQDGAWQETQRALTAMQQEQGLFFGTRPLVSVLRPRLISRAQYAMLQHACGLVGGALRTLGDAMLGDATLRASIALTPQEEALVHMDPGYAEHSAHSRMDTFLTIDGQSLQFVEYNGESPAAIAYEDSLSAVFLELPAMRAFAKEYSVATLPARHKLLETLLTAWRSFGGSTAPRVAILDWNGLPTRSEFLLFQRYFHEHGIEAAICTPDHLIYRDGRLLATRYETLGQTGGDFPIDLVYKRVLTSELLQTYGDDALAHPLMLAYAAGKVCVVNSFRAKLLHKKAIFALLTDDALQPMFTPEQRQAIAAHVPWTRMVQRGETRYQGDAIELLDFARRNKERLILKPNDEYGGKGIVIGWESSADQWDTALADALATPSVVQERVTIAYEDYPAVIDGQLQIGRRLVDTDPFMFGSEVTGTLCRLSTVTLLNVTAGGGSTVPAFVLE